MTDEKAFKFTNDVFELIKKAKTFVVDALVFYQFGKYLTKMPGQPIIDQHVIRSFAVYDSKDISQVKALRKLKKLGKEQKLIINKYKDWLLSDELTEELRNEPNYGYHIDT